MVRNPPKNWVLWLRPILSCSPSFVGCGKLKPPSPNHWKRCFQPTASYKNSSCESMTLSQEPRAENCEQIALVNLLPCAHEQNTPVPKTICDKKLPFKWPRINPLGFRSSMFTISTISERPFRLLRGLKIGALAEKLTILVCLDEPRWHKLARSVSETSTTKSPLFSSSNVREQFSADWPRRQKQVFQPLIIKEVLLYCLSTKQSSSVRKISLKLW